AKVEELKALLQDAGATLVLFDEPLSPVQGTNLERARGVRVMDRTEVILDIFATRARSAEAKMQVELAQHEYLLPRLTRMLTHLSRIRGGIGLRGPGETQLETDRRVIRRRIAALKRRLEEVAGHRANQRRGRRECPSAALVGYTNAGKSSLLRALSGDDIFVEDRLFATLDTLTREVEVGGGYRFRLTDTVGFIRKLPHHLVASFRATLEEACAADLLLHVIDAAHPAWEEQVEVVDKELRIADCGGGTGAPAGDPRVQQGGPPARPGGVPGHGPRALSARRARVEYSAIRTPQSAIGRGAVAGGVADLRAGVAPGGGDPRAGGGGKAARGAAPRRRGARHGAGGRDGAGDGAGRGVAARAAAARRRGGGDRGVRTGDGRGAREQSAQAAAANNRAQRRRTGPELHHRHPRRQRLDPCLAARRSIATSALVSIRSHRSARARARRPACAPIWLRRYPVAAYGYFTDVRVIRERDGASPSARAERR